MLAKQNDQKSIIASLFRASWVLLLLLLVAGAGSARAQVDPKKGNLPAFQNYKGVKIGMTADEVRTKLGKAQSDDKDGFMYVFENDEIAQILLDAAQKVRTISIMYGTDCTKQPAFTEIFGNAVEPEKQAGGGIYKVVHYKDAGYWLSYNRNAGDKASVMVVMQKLP